MRALLKIIGLVFIIGILAIPVTVLALDILDYLTELAFDLAFLPFYLF